MTTYFLDGRKKRDSRTLALDRAPSTQTTRSYTRTVSHAGAGEGEGEKEVGENMAFRPTLWQGEEGDGEGETRQLSGEGEGVGYSV